MVKAEFKKDPVSGSLIMTMRGHARSGDAGKDLICASCSTLAFTLAHLTQFMHAQGKLQKEPRVLLRPGRAEIVARTKEEFRAEALFAFFYTQAGLYLLEENFPENVQVKRFDQGESLLTKEPSP